MTAHPNAKEAAAMRLNAPSGASSERSILTDLVLARAAVAGGVSRPELIKDVAPLLAPRFATAGAQALIEATLAELVMDGRIRENKYRFLATDEGIAQAAALLGARKGDGPAWSEIRDIRLLGAALGLEGQGPARYKALATPDGVRALALASAFGFKLKAGGYSPSRVRTSLAMVALERAFGNTVKGGLGSGKGLPAKAARLLAGQLSRTPRDFGTDSRLVAALAAEQAGVDATDIDALKIGLLRQWVNARLAAMPVGALQATPAPLRVPGVVPPSPAPHEAANDAAPARPDLKGFGDQVIEAASRCAEGWSGNRKAYISHVWRELQADHPQWRLSEIEFKCMLAEAHRAGHVTLANADLKDKRQLKDVQDSAVAYKNTVWHFVRVED